MPTNTDLIKQLATIKKSNDVRLPADDARAFMLDATGKSSLLSKLVPHFAMSATGQLDELGVKSRQIREHLGTATTPGSRDSKLERGIPFALTAVYWDEWISNSNVVYTAQMRGQNVRQALLTLIQSQFGADIQDLAINGDTDSVDPFLSIKDGFLKKAEAAAVNKKVDYTAVPTVTDLTQFTKNYEDKYVSMDFKFIMNRATYLDLVSAVQARTTQVGDTAFVEGKLTAIAGYGIEVVEHMPANVILHTPLANLKPVFGYDVQLKSVGDDSLAIAKDATYHFMLSSVDFVILQPKALGYIEYTVTP